VVNLVEPRQLTPVLEFPKIGQPLEKGRELGSPALAREALGEHSAADGARLAFPPGFRPAELRAGRLWPAEK
jgi:hypothetical protein